MHLTDTSGVHLRQILTPEKQQTTLKKMLNLRRVFRDYNGLCTVIVHCYFALLFLVLFLYQSFCTVTETSTVSKGLEQKRNVAITTRKFIQERRTIVSENHAFCSDVFIWEREFLLFNKSQQDREIQFKLNTDFTYILNAYLFRQDCRKLKW